MSKSEMRKMTMIDVTKGSRGYPKIKYRRFDLPSRFLSANIKHKLAETNEERLKTSAKERSRYKLNYGRYICACR